MDSWGGRIDALPWLASLAHLSRERGKRLGRCLAQRHNVRVDVERDARPSVPRPLRQLASDDAGLVPYGDPAVPEIVRMVVRQVAPLGNGDDDSGLGPFRSLVLCVALADKKRGPRAKGGLRQGGSRGP